MALLIIFYPSSNVHADELPQLPTAPSLTRTPPLPSLVAYGTPKPPGILENATVRAPDIDFWKEKSLNWPVQGLITSGYGPRGRAMHRGIDIPVPTGTPIVAAASGVVEASRTFNGYGYAVIIDHKDGLRTLYAHCSRLAVSKGDQVERGQVIAYAGNTGDSTTPHLHFEVMLRGAHRDPVVYLKEKQQQQRQQTLIGASLGGPHHLVITVR